MGEWRGEEGWRPRPIPMLCDWARLVAEEKEREEEDNLGSFSLSLSKRSKCFSILKESSRP